jgi:hypothetical protein
MYVRSLVACCGSILSDHFLVVDVCVCAWVWVYSHFRHADNILRLIVYVLSFFLSLNIAAFDSDVVEIAKNDTQDFLGVLDEILKAATRNYFTTTASSAPEI